MKITVKADVFQKFNSDLKIAFILAKNVDNHAKIDESRHVLKEIEHLAQLNFHNKNIRGNKFIEPWALAQLEFAGKARHYHTSVEKLLKTVLSGRTISMADTANNITRYIALKYLIPEGLDDFHKVDGNLTFDVIKSSGRKGLLGTLKRGELYYYDAQGVLGTKVDYWKNKRTEVNKKSYVVLVHLLALPPITKNILKQVTKELSSLLEAFCSAKTEIFFLDKMDREIII